MKKMVFFLFCLNPLYAQHQEAEGFSIACPLNPNIVTSNHSPTRSLKLHKASSKFEIDFKNVPAAIQVICHQATQMWSQYLISSVPIKLQVNWEPLEDNLLAKAGSEKVFKNFPHAPLKDTWYPAALAEAISGKNINGNTPDINLTINSKANWNLDPNTQHNKYDLFSVLIHEITHGLGFICSFESEGNKALKWGIQGFPMIFDRYIVDRSNTSLVNNRFYTNNSVSLYQTAISKDIYFNLLETILIPTSPKLHSPSPFDAGASFSHLDAQVRNLNDPNDGMMFPSLYRGAMYDQPGKSVLAILYQLGWPIQGLSIVERLAVDSPALNVYPNPVDNHFSVKNAQIQFPHTAYIFDINGKLVHEQLLSQAEEFITISHLPGGTYVLQLAQQTSTFIKK